MRDFPLHQVSVIYVELKFQSSVIPSLITGRRHMKSNFEFINYLSGLLRKKENLSCEHNLTCYAEMAAREKEDRAELVQWKVKVKANFG